MEIITKVILLVAFQCFVATKAIDLSSLGAPVKTTFSLKNSQDGTDILTSSPSWRRRLVTEKDFISPKGIDLEFKAEGKNHIVHFNKAESAFTDGCKVHVANDDGVTEEELPDVFSFSSEEGALTLTNDEQGFDALFVQKGKAYHIVSLDLQHVEVDTSSSLDGECATAVKPDGNKLRALSSIPSSADHLAHSHRELAVNTWENCYDKDDVKRTFSIGIAIGSMLFERFGSKSKAISFVNSVVADANQIYSRQLNIELKVGDIFIKQSRTGAPEFMNHKHECRDTWQINEQLDAFTNWDRPSEQGLWHYFDDCFRGGVVGIAWVGALCGRGYNSGVTWYTSNGSWKTFAHEVGHNFAAGHSFEDGQGNTGGIMDYGSGKLDGEYQFNSKYRKSQICKHLNSKVNSCKHFNLKNMECEGTSSCKKNGKSGVCNHGTCKTPTPKPTPVPTPAPIPPVNTDQCKKHSKYYVAGTADLYKGGQGYSFNDCANKCFNNKNCKMFTFSEKTGGYCETWKTVAAKDDLVKTSRGFDTYVCGEDENTGGDDDNSGNGSGGGGKSHEDYCSEFSQKNSCLNAPEKDCLWKKSAKKCVPDTKICKDYWSKKYCKKNSSCSWNNNNKECKDK